jgi:hypothetical protein
MDIEKDPKEQVNGEAPAPKEESQLHTLLLCSPSATQKSETR